MKIALRKMWSTKAAMATLTFGLSLGTVHSVTAVNLSQVPLFMAQPVRPVVMLNMSNDHQLFYKAYDDYTDLDPEENDGPDTTYKNSIEYYGYFNSNLCYDYNSGVFVSSGAASNHHCSGNWSGNFLNWATMTRMDTVRKILYGGKRAVDTDSRTVLERAFLPQDAHSFAKYYNGSDLSSLTPFSTTEGVTFCNTTEPDSRSTDSQDVTAPPLMRVAKGNFTLWASNERWQCRWSGDVSGTQGDNFNDPDWSGIDAGAESPAKGAITTNTQAEYHVRVEVCNGSSYEEGNFEGCRQYAAENWKPTGLLQEYGEDDTILFGLMTGSYSKNKSGGMLRKNVTSFSDEVNPATGQFVSPAEGGPGIVATLDAMRIVRYDYNIGHYNNTDNCAWGVADFNNGNCSNWGNPQAEIYLESLRYLAGRENPTGQFTGNDSNYLSVLESIDWVDPINDDNYCAPLNVIQFNASTTSFDGDELSGASDIGLASVDAATNTIGTKEGISGQYFVGFSGSEDDDQLCTAKTVSSLSSVRGTCPDAPRLQGSYHIAGLAYHARVEGIEDGREKVKTYGVALAPAVPRVEVPVPGAAGRKVTILPACRNSAQNPAVGDGTNCAIVDFKLIPDETAPAGVNRGSAYINWEDTEQGGDYDQDMWGMLEYEVTSEEVSVTTRLIAQSTSQAMGFGYILSGTDSDGFHVHSGTHNFVHTFPEEYYLNDRVSCGNGVDCFCTSGDFGQCQDIENASITQTYGLGNSSASLLEQPLYYAAKWGGFADNEDGSERTEPAADAEVPYHYAVDPWDLVEGMKKLLDNAAKGVGSSASVATNSTRRATDTFIYQAIFNSDGWYGDIRAFRLNDEGVNSDPVWTASGKLPTATNRNIYTSNGSEIVEFKWSNLTEAQQLALNADELGEKRLKWLRGEDQVGLRKREDGEILGDIVNADPVYFGTGDYGFSRLPETHGSASYNSYVSSKSNEMLYVHANDGKLHAFDANTGNEIFAYVPNGIYDKLAQITESDYGSVLNQHLFTVDGQITVSDVYMGGWKTILVGTFGAGAEGAYVLDVTNPMAPSLIHEFSGTDIGYILGKPAVVPLPTGNWAIVFGNGYKQGSGNRAKLIVAELDASGVNEIHAMDTGVGGDNGLAEPEFMINNDWTVSYAYAGDLMGNMWKFDLSAPGGNKSVTKLFSAPGQPITAAPTLGLNPFKRDPDTGEESIMVYFGTGRYMSASDMLLEDVATQSFYGIADTGSNSGLERTDLHQNTLTQTGGARTANEAQRNGELDWESEDINGWFVDFPVQGERVVNKAVLAFDTLFFPTMIPTDQPCEFGGTSWIMQLTGVGLYPKDPEDQLESIEEDTLVKLSDMIMPDVPCTGDDCNNTPPCEGDECEPEPEDECEKGMIVVQRSNGELTTINPCIPGGAYGRQSWRQLR